MFGKMSGNVLKCLNNLEKMTNYWAKSINFTAMRSFSRPSKFLFMVFEPNKKTVRFWKCHLLTNHWTKLQKILKIIREPKNRISKPLLSADDSALFSKIFTVYYQSNGLNFLKIPILQLCMKQRSKKNLFVVENITGPKKSGMRLCCFSLQKPMILAAWSSSDNNYMARKNVDQH